LLNLGAATAVEEEVGVEAAVEEEEAGIEATIEEAGSSGVDGGGGDQWSRERWGLRKFWNEKRNDTGHATIYRFENINNSSLITTAAGSFRIRTEAVFI
jgi:hypothetical protein